jgi:uncharacterized protein YfaS (alpha-2-macroglobulin family)
MTLEAIPMTTRAILFLAICPAFLLLSCAPPDGETLRIVSDLPEGEIPRDRAIVIAFSRGVVPQDTVNRWTTTPFLDFAPPIRGKFVWQDTSRLVFSPDGPLAGDTEYRGTLNTKLLAELAGATSFEGESRFSFSTERFLLRGAEFFYDRIGEERKVGIKANLEFTYAVRPEDLALHLRVTLDGKEQPVGRVLTREESRVMAVEIGEVTRLEKEREIALDVAEGLVSPETQTRIKRDRPLVYTLPPLAELSIYGHEVGFDGTTSWIRIRTSQEVDAPSVKSSLTIEPLRRFTLQTQTDGFTIRGSFEPGTTFRLRLAEGMLSVLGGKLQNDYQAEIVVGDVQPSFGFASPHGQYMLLGGERVIEARTVNLSELTVRVSQVFQNNLVFFLDGGRYYDYYWEPWGGDASSRRRKYRYVVGNYGHQLSYDTIGVTAETNREVTTRLDLNPYLKTGYRGFFVVEIANPAQAWRSTSQLVVLSDLGLILKKGRKELMIFVVNLLTGDPVADATVQLLSTNNQVIGTAGTEGDGVARFPEFSREGLPLKIVTAEAGDDFTFLNLADHRVETSRFDVSGRRESPGLYDAFLYGDRNIYRPGEKVLLSGIVRDLGAPIPERMPVKLRVFNPQGKLVEEQQHLLNDQGSFETSFPTEATALTGEYRFDLVTGADRFLATYRVSLEEFVPDRLRVRLTPSSDVARPGDTLRYDLLALNFFGPPAAGRTWEFEGSFENLPYRSGLYPDFRFQDDAARQYAGPPLVVSGKTDGEGRAEIAFPLPKQLTSTGLLRARGRVAVFDESGRPVYQIARTTVFPRDYLIGLKYGGAYYVAPGSRQKMDIVAVDREDRPIPGFRAKIDLVRYEWHSVLRQHGGTGTLRYVSEKREILIRSDVLTLTNGPLEYTFAVTRSGEYSLRVSKEGETGYNQLTFHSYRWGTTDMTSFAVDPEARVEVVLDRETYAPGDRARVLFQTPFDGRLLVTVERNSVYSYRYLDVVDNAASLEIPVTEEFLPTVYIGAVLFRKIRESDIPLMAGHGFAPLLVERASNRLDVRIAAPGKIRPGTSQKVTVSVGNEKDVCVTLAAVDEGICQVKNYETPDPYAHFYARRALETETYDFFRDLIPEPRAKSSTGGGAAEMALRVNPLGVMRFKPVALWSGILRTDASGDAEVALDIPQFNGELRLMAVAYKENRFGSATRPMTVSDPVVITPALPRFLSPGDSLTMAITAFNTTGDPVALTFSVETSGPVEADRSRSLSLGPNEERSVDLRLRARAEIGPATVVVKTKAFGETLASATELSVRPVSPYVADVVTGFIDGGRSVEHAVPDLLLPYGREAYVSLSPFPVVNFARELKALIGYPHGCLEQIVSRAFPQVYLRDLAAVLDPGILEKGSPTYFVNEAIRKLVSMQMYDGGFLYWPGGGEANNWSTVYATHFLLEAKKAGYAVPGSVLDPALRAVAGIARSKATQDSYSRTGQRTVVRRIADKSCIYALYVLALSGNPERSVMNFYRRDPGLLTLDTRYLLGGAFSLSGDRGAYRELIPSQFALETAERTSGGNFDSPIRSNAIVLNVLLETDLNNPGIPRYLDYLSRAYGSRTWYSTQDNAFTLLAFGKAARVASGANVTGTVSVGETRHTYEGGDWSLPADLFGKKVRLETSGEGRVYYSIVTKGIRRDGEVAIQDRNLKVRREFFDRTGSAADPTAVRQNDLMIVRVTLTSSVNLLDNVAVTDLLPAGLEIENPRITETTAYPFIKNAASPEHLDIRDDRIIFYTSFTGRSRQQVFYYVVRAVSRGTFHYPALVAEAMYDGRYYSASGRGLLTVR